MLAVEAGFKIAVESYADVIGEIKPLLEMHWQEIATYRDHIPLDPDYARYQAAEAAGNLLILTARHRGVLVGYSIFFMLAHPHYKSTLFAMNDIIFLHPDLRGGMLGPRLIKASEEEVRSRGAMKISWHIKPSHDFSPLLKRMGYALDEINMAKILED